MDLTFTPRNYFVYGPMPDIVNPDCYPIVIGWSVRAVRDKLSLAKRGSAPRFLTYTYQNMWEEWAHKDTPMPWMGGFCRLLRNQARRGCPGRSRCSRTAKSTLSWPTRQWQRNSNSAIDKRRRLQRKRASPGPRAKGRRRTPKPTETD